MLRYEMMLPHQIRTAIEKRWPVVLPLGVLEYHGEHLPVGMDTLAVTGILGILETETDLVILPPFYYGAASYAVEPPESNGSLNVDAEALLPFAKAMFQGLLRIGFRNLHVVIHHQTENFAAGMPTDLENSRRVRRSSPFSRKIAERGGGDRRRWRLLRAAIGRRDPFNWIKTHPLMTPEAMEGYPFDHAGQGETSLMMALFPDAVHLSRLSDEKWYVRSAKDASFELGAQGRDRILAHLRVALR